MAIGLEHGMHQILVTPSEVLAACGLRHVILTKLGLKLSVAFIASINLKQWQWECWIWKLAYRQQEMVGPPNLPGSMATWALGRILEYYLAAQHRSYCDHTPTGLGKTSLQLPTWWGWWRELTFQSPTWHPGTGLAPWASVSQRLLGNLGEGW